MERRRRRRVVILNEWRETIRRKAWGLPTRGHTSPGKCFEPRPSFGITFATVYTINVFWTRSSCATKVVGCKICARETRQLDVSMEYHDKTTRRDEAVQFFLACFSAYNLRGKKGESVYPPLQKSHWWIPVLELLCFQLATWKFLTVSRTCIYTGRVASH